MGRQRGVGGRWTIFLVLVAVVLGLVAWVAGQWAGDTDPLGQASDVAGVSSLIVAVLAFLVQLVLALWPVKATNVDRAQEIANTADDLAKAVRKRSSEEERRQKVHDPVPLPVRWHNAPDDLVDGWENIRGAPVGARSEALRLDNTVDEIARTFRSIPSRRLVVLGQAGSGKTVLAHHLISQLVDQRASTDPVPVLFRLNSWDVATPLREWLVEQLRRDYDLDHVDSTGTPLAQALVDDDWILPVLDGFDEITAERRATAGSHRAALSTLNDSDLPMVLTSRPDEYRAAVSGDIFLARAAAVELEDLTLDDLADYLVRTTRKKPGGDGETAWDPVIRRLRDQPQDTASAQLRRVLTTPLMVFLARTNYSAPSRRDPAELLNANRFPSTGHLEEHLLEAFIPAIYAEKRGRRGPGWRVDQAEKWLGYLAEHLTKRNTHDLAWWQLGGALHRHTRVLVITSVVGIVTVLGFFAAQSVISTVSMGAGDWFALDATNRFKLVESGIRSGFERAVMDAIPIGLTAGFAVGLMNEAKYLRGGTQWEPERLRLHVRSVGRPGRLPGIKKLAAEFTVGLSLALLVLFAYQFPFVPWADTLIQMLKFGLALGILNIGIAMSGDSRDPQESIVPWKSLSDDRAVVLVRAITFGVAAAVVLRMNGSNPADLVTGIVYGIPFVLVRLTLSAWGNWLLFVRLWLPLTRRLPWRPKRFLEDADGRGLLRQAGAVYQFRHARLRDHCTGNYRNRSRIAPSGRRAPAELPSVSEGAPLEERVNRGSST